MTQPLLGWGLTPQALTGVAPFTYRDNATYIQILQDVRNKVDELVAAVNTNAGLESADVAAINAAYNALVVEWTAILATLDPDAVHLLIPTLEADIESITATLAGLAATIAGKLNTTDLDSSMSTIARTSTSLTARALSGMYGAHVSVDAYGAVGDGVADDTSAINAALSAIHSSPLGFGKLLLRYGGIYKTTGGHNTRGVFIDASGAEVFHTGNNTLFNFNGDGAYSPTPMGIEGATIVGNTGDNAIALEFGNSFGSFISKSTIREYLNGVGLLLCNRYNWTEGFSIDGLFTQNVKTNIRFFRAGGTVSFAYARFQNFALNIISGGVGFDFDASGGEIQLYNSDVSGNFWIVGDHCSAISVEDGVICHGNRFYITGERNPTYANTDYATIRATGGQFWGFGSIFISDQDTTGDQNVPSIIDPSATVRILAGGETVTTYVNNGESIQPQLYASRRYGYLGSIGFVEGANLVVPYVSSYALGDAFRVYRTGFNTELDTATVAFRVTQTGGLKFGTSTEMDVRYGSGDPTHAANPGSIYMRTVGDAGHSIYVKGTGADASGWVAVTTNPATSWAPMALGRYYGTDGAGSTTLAPANNTLRGGLMAVGQDCTLIEIGVETTVVGAAGSLVRLGIYKINPVTWQATLLIDAGTVDGSASIGYKSLSISQAVKNGDYLLLVATPQGVGTTPTLRANTGNSLFIGSATGLEATSTPIIGITVSGVSGSLPSSISLHDGTFIVPRVVVKVGP